MRIKKVLKLVAPPLLFEGASRIIKKITKSTTPYYFKGIYSSFDEVSLPTGNGFAVENGVQWAVEKAKSQRRRTPNWMAVGSLSPGDHFLTMLINDMLAEGPVEVWDLGGGAGNTYVSAKPYFYRQDLRWRLVELPSVAVATEELFRGDPNFLVDVSFSPEVKTHGKVISLFRAAVQYFPDPEVWIQSVAPHSQYIAFIRLTAGDVPDFWAAQNFRGTWHPFRFFNLNKFITFVENLGFALVARCGETETLDMGNFPPDHRLNQTVSLFFKKKN